jgi:ubiquinone/menaquinone biosynthesis C-methylase UbiE
MIREIVHFVRVAPAARRLQARMSFLDCYDFVERDLDEAGKRQFRAALAGDLDGAVLEIGAGTGLMLAHYRAGTWVVATDPDDAALRRAAPRAKQSSARVWFVEARAESLPFPDATFDAVVGASVLCSVQSMGRPYRRSGGYSSARASSACWST